jgi:hypothetical protein
MKQIPGFPGYFADELGNIWSSKRYAESDWRKLRGVIRSSKVKYLSVSVKGVNDKFQLRYVHELVCMTFHGEKPPGGFVVRHLNGNCLDNKPNNLRWGTHHANTKDAIKHGKVKLRLTDAQVGEIRLMRNSGRPVRELGKIYGVSHQLVSLIQNHKRRQTPIGGL